MYFRKFQSELEKHIADAQLIVINQFTTNRLKNMEAELKAARENQYESLFDQQLVDVTTCIERSENLFQKTVVHDQELIDNLESKLARSDNGRVKSRLEKQLTAAKEKLKRKREKQNFDKEMLNKHQQILKEKRASARKNKEKYIAELEKKIAAYKLQKTKLETEIKTNDTLHKESVAFFTFGCIVAAVGLVAAGPVVTALGAVFAGASAFTSALEIWARSYDGWRNINTR